MTPVTVIGAGLAGSECAWQLARRGVPVRLVEMKPQKMTPAHSSSPHAGKIALVTTATIHPSIVNCFIFRFPFH